MSRSVSAPSLVTKTSPCWNGFIVPGSTLRYGSSFCMVTRRPRDCNSCPSEEAVSPLPSEEATPPVTNRCLVGDDAANLTPVGSVSVRREHPPLHGVPIYQHLARTEDTTPTLARLRIGRRSRRSAAVR